MTSLFFFFRVVPFFLIQYTTSIWSSILAMLLEHGGKNALEQRCNMLLCAQPLSARSEMI